MASRIEEKLRYCHKCKKQTRHQRNNSYSSGFMLLVHFILTLVTLGAWLLVIIVWKVLNAKIGGWRCGVCR